MSLDSAPMRPTPDQIRAADPRRSAWVGANAGSGKTRVLTQRVARLLLAGAEPQKILCLTYTKAAAAEMQNRLFKMLGQWAMAPDDLLSRELSALEGQDAPVVDRGILSDARRLFARALETPGGLKIQTIHAFCDALLRRFPLEAGLSPRFEVLDDRQSTALIAEIRRDLADAAIRGEDDIFDQVAALLNEDDLDSLIRSVLANRDAFSALPVDDRLRAHFPDEARLPPGEIAERQIRALASAEIDDFQDVLAEGGKVEQAVAEALKGRHNETLDAQARVDAIVAKVLTGKHLARQRDFPTKVTRSARPDAAALCENLTNWALQTRELFNAQQAAARAKIIETFGGAILSRYASAKTARGVLDFDDLVKHAQALLTRSDLAEWVLWKLDKGIDHLLVDEAQDTSPGQWEVIKAIAREFHAGQGARESERTLFVVGDEKQSIYSFQGAEPHAFGSTRDALEAWLDEMDQRLERPGLVTSFRSAPGILQFVDRVFQGGTGEGLTVSQEPIQHDASRRSDPARIDLWPMIENDPQPDPRPFYELPPVDAALPGSPKRRLATILAAEIRRMMAEENLPGRDGKPARSIRPGDILVLVRKRDALARGLIQALKSLDVPVAGADRLILTQEIAVKDLVALMKIAVTPGDDLSLAALLRSPLCGLSEDDLFILAHNRGDIRLWDRLQKGEHHAEARDFLRNMSDEADFLRPYEFLERALIRHGGRAKLIARLGAEAEDPIDELLAAALDYERSAPPSLTAFIAWLEAREIQIKREMEQAPGEVRVMTVHGAKGLEAPIVILPDTTGKAASGRGQTLLPVGGGGAGPPLVLWPGSAQHDDDLTAQARTAAAARTEAEYKRLLYVALTRAEDWLILCGAGQASRATDSWYTHLDRAMSESAPRDIPAPDDRLDGPIRRLEDPGWAQDAVAGSALPEKPKSRLAPEWISRAAAEQRPTRHSASDLITHAAHGARTATGDMAREHGTAVHLMLELLTSRSDSAGTPDPEKVLAKAMPHLEPAARLAAIREAEAVLAHPDLRQLFDSAGMNEVSLSLPIQGGVVSGRADRIVKTERGFLIVDFKSDAVPPEAPEETPRAYLTQLGAYRAALCDIYPDTQLETAIIWTSVPRLMLLSEELVTSALKEGLSAKQLPGA